MVSLVSSWIVLAFVVHWNIFDCHCFSTKNFMNTLLDTKTFHCHDSTSLWLSFLSWVALRIFVASIIWRVMMLILLLMIGVRMTRWLMVLISIVNAFVIHFNPVKCHWFSTENMMYTLLDAKTFHCHDSTSLWLSILSWMTMGITFTSIMCFYLRLIRWLMIWVRLTRRLSFLAKEV